MIKTKNIRIRDPFILPVPEEQYYYMFGTSDKTCWRGKGVGFDCYKSKNLSDWEGPIAAFRPPKGFWGTMQFWAAEVHKYKDNYYMFSTFKAKKHYRGTQILISEKPTGPYRPLTDGPVTPPDWGCLDGTLFIDEKQNPWIIFCQEWTQIGNGAIWAMALTEDLTEPAGRPVFLFSASEAPWVKSESRCFSRTLTKPGTFPGYITDGPFLHRTAEGALLMLWSSMGQEGYAMGIARSESGRIEGPWIQDKDPIWKKDGGHGMIFHDFENRLIMTFHQPNCSPGERAVFKEIEEKGGTLRIK